MQQELCSLVEKSARIQRRMCLNLIYNVKKIVLISTFELPTSSENVLLVETRKKNK